MPPDDLGRRADRALAACRLIADQIRADPRYGHTSHLALLLDDRLVYDRHFRGPAANDVFSVTKTVLATLVGTAQRRPGTPGASC